MRPAVIENALAIWRRLAPRERAALGALGTFVAMVLLYVAIWSPLQRSLARLRTQVPIEQARLVEMREQATLVGRIRGTALPAPPVNPVAFVGEAAARNGLGAALKRAEPEGAKGVRVQLEAAPFASVVTWLAELQQNGLRAETAALEAHATPGTVSARLLLRIPGA
jgi:general secretion pathway protein M